MSTSGKGPGGSRGAIARELGSLVLGQVRNALAQRSELARSARGEVQTTEEPPVVAQLMIEIRADGSRTIARGALNDLRTAESAQVYAEGRTPTELMASLASSLLALPSSIMRWSKPTANARELQPDAKDPAKRSR
jgi:hypothetical protein